MNMQNTGFDTAAPILSDEQIEAEVFRKLEAAQEAERKRAQEGVIFLQYPDNRTVFQRLRAWWYVRQNCADTDGDSPVVAIESEPIWPRHWATTKYL